MTFRVAATFCAVATACLPVTTRFLGNEARVSGAPLTVLSALDATTFKDSPEDSSTLHPEDLCPVAAGTELSVTILGGTPGGLLEVALAPGALPCRFTQGYLWAPSFSGIPSSSGSVHNSGPSAPAVATGPNGFAWPIAGHSVRPLDCSGLGDYHAPRTGHPHEGVDLLNSPGTQVVSPRDGTVSFAGDAGAKCGNLLTVQHGQIGGSYYLSRYCHLSSYVASGESVLLGDPLGASGRTGNASKACIASHLHFELRKGSDPNGSSSNTTPTDPMAEMPSP